jgi:putative nucleotidyltransferase with HDIG domain
MAGRPVRIDVRQLRLGLYVSLGERWLDHSFLFNSFRLSNETQIARIRDAGFTHVDYYPDRSTATPLPLPSAAVVPSPPAASAVALAAQAFEADLQAARSAQLDERRRRTERVAARRAALAACERAYRRSVGAVKALMAEVFVAPREAGEKAGVLVDDIVADLLQNQHAVVNLMTDVPTDAGARYHALNVMILSLLLGRAAGLQGEALRLLGLGALLHDIGKVHLPPAVLRVDPSQRSRHEEAAYRQHVEYGTTQCLELGFDQAAVLHVVRHHHERMDGSGWPDRLHGTHIPLPTRIVAIANRYDGLCHAPDPRRSMTPSEALATMYRHESATLDRGLLQRFIKCLGVWPPGTLVQLSNGVTGLVTAVEPEDTMRPTVLVGDLSVPRAEAVIVDLREATDVKVERALRPADVDGAVLAYLAPRTQVNYFVGIDTSG